MVHKNTVTSSSGKPSLLRSILSLLLVNVAIPYGCYTLLKGYNASDITALGVAAIAPTLEALGSVLRGRQVNVISLFILGGLLFGIISTFLGGDPRLLLLKESFFTGALGIICFMSLLFPRPLMFSVGRSLIAGKDPAHIARYNQSWLNPSARRTSRVITVAWGIVYCSEFLLRLLLIFILPIAAVVAVGPIITGCLIGGSFLWTFAYLRSARQRIRMKTVSSAGEPSSENDRQSATTSR